jgi:three-Cys-motif partner protein
MPDPSLYVGREQTYVKHFFLKCYLERVAYNIYSFQNDFVYVDGFSGPWKAAAETYKDTSFSLALDQLRAVRLSLKVGRGKDVTFRCLFVEKDPRAFAELKTTVAGIDDVPIELINGKFEEHIADAVKFVGQSFSLIFIDPTGWTGYPLRKITPLLKLRGEVLINFMSDHITRFIDDPRPNIAQQFDQLFGAAWFEDWKVLHEAGMTREAAAIEVYTERLKKAGNYAYVTSTRILKPKSDRTYFYLIYATRHWKGIEEFRAVEQKAVDVQESLRQDVKYQASVLRTGQPGLFGSSFTDGAVATFEDERTMQLEKAHAKLLALLRSHTDGIMVRDLIGPVMETPLTWKSDLNGWIKELKEQGKIDVIGMRPRERTYKPEHRIIPKGVV